MEIGGVTVKTSAPHYKAYVTRPFLPAERDDVEILFGGLHWRAESVIQAVLENLGYRARPLPPATRTIFCSVANSPTSASVAPQVLSPAIWHTS